VYPEKARDNYYHNHYANDVEDIHFISPVAELCNVRAAARIRSIRQSKLHEMARRAAGVRKITATVGNRNSRRHRTKRTRPGRSK
jgi:hypothetical protein